MTSGPITSRQIDEEKVETVTDLFSWAPKSLWTVAATTKVTAATAPWKKSYDKPRQHIKRQRYHFANKGLSSQSYGFFGSHVWM